MSDRLAEIQRHIDTEPVTLYGLRTWRELACRIQVDEDRIVHTSVRELEAQLLRSQRRQLSAVLAGWLGDWDEDGDAEVRAFTRLLPLAASAAREGGKNDNAIGGDRGA